ncbi:hypothetical protein A2U01_0056046, partial [Trifolium medium]|nr:hypothetical protein [Trifolium medium]
KWPGSAIGARRGRLGARRRSCCRFLMLVLLAAQGAPAFCAMRGREYICKSVHCAAEKREWEAS